MKKITVISIIILLLLSAVSAYLVVNKGGPEPEQLLQDPEKHKVISSVPAPEPAETVTETAENETLSAPAKTPEKGDKIPVEKHPEEIAAKPAETGPDISGGENKDSRDEIKAEFSESEAVEFRKKMEAEISAEPVLEISEKTVLSGQPEKQAEKTSEEVPVPAKKQDEIVKDLQAVEKTAEPDLPEKETAQPSGKVHASVEKQDEVTEKSPDLVSGEFIRKEAADMSPMAVVNTDEGIIEQPEKTPEKISPESPPRDDAIKLKSEKAGEEGAATTHKTVDLSSGEYPGEASVNAGMQTAGESSGSVSGPESALKAGKRIAVLSFDNFSDASGALDIVMPAVRERLEEKGLAVVSERRVNEFLCEEGIRSTGHISNEMMRKVKDRFVVKTILAGSVVSFSQEENPRIGLLSRLINASTGNILWADYVSLSGDDFASVLGLGKIKSAEKLVPKVVDKLFSSFTTAGINKNTESAYRIAVLPFRNKSEFSNAGMVAMYMFLVELLKNYEFEPIEYGEVRNLIIDLRIRSRGVLDYKNLDALADALGISGVLVGTVERYSSGINTSSPPQVAVTARLLDAGMNKIVWYNSVQHDGEKKMILFDWDRTMPVDKVAHNVVSDLVKKMKVAGQSGN